MVFGVIGEISLDTVMLWGDGMKLKDRFFKSLKLVWGCEIITKLVVFLR